MKEKTWFEKMLDSVEDSFGFRLETIILDLTEQVCKRMKNKNITRTQLAEKLQVSPAAVSKVLNGNPNFTIKTLLQLADALNLNLDIKFTDRTVFAQVQPQPRPTLAITSTNFTPDIPWGTYATSSSACPTRSAEL